MRQNSFSEARKVIYLHITKEDALICHAKAGLKSELLTTSKMKCVYYSIPPGCRYKEKFKKHWEFRKRTASGKRDGCVQSDVINTMNNRESKLL